MTIFMVNHLIGCLIFSIGIYGNLAKDADLEESFEQLWEKQDFLKLSDKFALEDESNSGLFTLREIPLIGARRVRREQMDAKEASGKDDGISKACLHCICIVESGCKEKVECGDKGKSCGPYQIQIAYWNEAGRPGKGWRACVDKFKCAEKTVQGYMSRYATFKRLKRNPTCQDYARIHNGGPNGYKRRSTLGYWEKIRKAGCKIDS